MKINIVVIRSFIKQFDHYIDLQQIGLYAHGAIMAAILLRQRTNKGQWIDCSLIESQVASLANIGSNYLKANK